MTSEMKTQLFPLVENPILCADPIKLRPEILMRDNPVAEVVAEAPAVEEVAAVVSEPTATDVVAVVPAQEATTDVVVEAAAEDKPAN